MKTRTAMVLLCLGLLSMAISCGSANFYRGKYLHEHKRSDEAVPYLEKAYKESPKKLEYQAILVRAKLEASQMHFEAAKTALAHEDYLNTVKELQIALEFDPSNQFAQDTLQKVMYVVDRKEKEARRRAVTLEDMKRESEKDTGIKKLDPNSNIPIVLKFNGTALKTVLDALSKASGINFLYDEKVEKEKKITVDFSNSTLESALEFIMMQTKHFYKVLDPHTLIVIPDSKQKREEYQEQVMRTFYLSNAEAKDVFQLVRSIIQGKKMAMNQDLNSITIKDDPETVALAQRIIEANDKSKGEVAVDVELIEVNASKTKNIGMNLTSRTFTLGPENNVTFDDAGNATGWNDKNPPVPLDSADSYYHGGLWISPLPNITVNLILDDSDTKILAKPQLRVMEGKKASVHIGNREPVPTANLYQPTSPGTNYYPVTSYTYQDVGVKIEIDDVKVHHNKEISIKLAAEVSAVLGYKGDQPIFGSRKVNTQIRLEDGETSLLAGLIREATETKVSGLPFFSEIPFLRRLVSNNNDTKASSDVVLLLTPHIIRMPNITEEDLRALWVGTEDRPRLQGFRESSFSEGPFDGEEAPGDVEPDDKKAPVDEKKAKEPEQKTAEPTPSPEKEKPQPQAQVPEPPEPPPPPADMGADEDDDEDGPMGPDDEEEEESPPEQPPKKEEPSQQLAKVLVSPASFSAQEGGVVMLNLVVVSANNAKGFRIDMDFPNDVVKFESAEEGTFLKMGGGTSTFNAQEARPGLLHIEMSRTDTGSSSGSGLVARIRMKATKAGQARLNFGSIQLIDAAGQSVTLQPASSMVTVTSAAKGGG